ncbi:hypothetical protein EXIGLDRAFT_780980 [Exidia glandulosa HHB12029]|uniref:Uncharacterized protein n=1 Tax=Exidia glandulosa HHB12029 TaxID=1314781 RepID=A0A165BDU3_EXIGL|nr:hypothetical protein EXIGLDRAFT_780980 [Exidia glandulosa HHB12029]
MKCRNARLHLTTIGRHALRIAQQLPGLCRLELEIEEDILSEFELRDGTPIFPSSLSSVRIQVLEPECNAVKLLCAICDTTKHIRTLEIELPYLGCDDLYWPSLFTDPVSPLRLRVGPPGDVSHPLSHLYSMPCKMALTVDSGDGCTKTVRWPDPELYGPVNRNSKPYWRQFESFSHLYPLCAFIQDVTIAHAFLPVIFALEELPALQRLEIHLDDFSGPFWMTRATNAANDYRSGDRTPPERSTLPSPQRFNDPSYANDWGESDRDGISQAHTDWERSVAECSLLNAFDEEKEDHLLPCPALETVVLRTSYSRTRVSTRQLAHFGRALGLLDRAAGNRPRLRLLGVELSSAKYGKLHLQVFDDVEQVSLTALNFRPWDAEEWSSEEEELDEGFSEAEVLSEQYSED